MGKMFKDTYGRSVQGAFLISVNQTVAYDGSVQSAALNSQTKLVRMLALTDAFIATGSSNPTASSSTMFLKAGLWHYLPVTAGLGWKIAGIKHTTASSLYIQELTV